MDISPRDKQHYKQANRHFSHHKTTQHGLSKSARFTHVVIAAAKRITKSTTTETRRGKIHAQNPISASVGREKYLRDFNDDV